MIDRSIRITATVALILEVAFTLLGRFAIPVLIFFSGSFGGSLRDYSDGFMYYITRNFIGGSILLVTILIFAILLINASKNRNESIGMEIAAMVIVGIALPIVNTIINVFSNYLVVRNLSMGGISASSMLSQISSFFGIVHSAAVFLLFISCTISICRKKFVIPLEYEKGIGVNEEYNTTDIGSYY